jgi:nucleoside-diphosphate kinase
MIERFEQISHKLLECSQISYMYLSDLCQIFLVKAANPYRHRQTIHTLILSLYRKNVTFAAFFINYNYFHKIKKKMAGNRTFTMVKPDAVKSGDAGAILAKIQESGFKIIAMKLTKMSKKRAGEFYAVHKERPFYQELVGFMSSGPIVAAILEKDNAVEDFRTLIGATNPANAAPGTLRKMFAKSVGENAVHGSDSDENAAIEGAFHFKNSELVG